MVNKMRILRLEQLLQVLQFVYIVMSTHIHVQNPFVAIKKALKEILKCMHPKIMDNQ